MWHAHLARDSRASRPWPRCQTHYHRSLLRLDSNTSRIEKTKERKNAKTNKCESGDRRRNELYSADRLEQLCSEIAQVDLHPGAGHGTVNSAWTDVQYYADHRGVLDTRRSKGLAGRVQREKER